MGGCSGREVNLVALDVVVTISKRLWVGMGRISSGYRYAITPLRPMSDVVRRNMCIS
jgi:hypothetical protein